MNKGHALSIVLVCAFALACLGMTFFMPWAELGFLTSPDPTGTWEPLMKFVTASGLGGLLAQVSNSVCGILTNVKNDPNSSYYIYSLFLGCALVAAAVGINVVGREEAEEKTILPLK